jgi:hypothetical protein
LHVDGIAPEPINSEDGDNVTLASIRQQGRKAGTLFRADRSTNTFINELAISVVAKSLTL